MIKFLRIKYNIQDKNYKDIDPFDDNIVIKSKTK